MNKIVVKNVNLQQNEVDRLNNTIEMRDNTIKYQQDQYMKLLRKVDCQEPYGLNCMLFTYEELQTILTATYHPLKGYIARWFDEDIEEGLYFSEDGIEVKKGDYWLVNVKTDYACVLDNLDRLNRKVYELEKVGE